MKKNAFTVRPITRTDFPLVEQLFGARGACGGCWCMVWRAPSTGAWWNAHKGAPNRAAFKALVESGMAHGCLAFDAAMPVAWCSVGPKADFAYFERARALPRTEVDGVWSLTCFFIPAAYRRCGLSALLIDAAAAHARAMGARYLEGYPTVIREGTELPPAFAHTGIVAPFLRAGFEPIGSAGSRQLMRSAL